MKNSSEYQVLFKPHAKSKIYLLYTVANHLLYPFTRRNIGERFFSFDLAICLAVFLAILPITLGPQLHKFSILHSGNFRDLKNLNHFSYVMFILKNISLYIFIGLFIYQSYLRHLEIKRLPSVFDLGRFSLSKGEINERFYDFKWGGKKVNTRFIEIILEPCLFGCIGLLLIICQQWIGYIIIVASLLCGLFCKLAYVLGDHRLMDILDDKIIASEMNNLIEKLKDGKETRGVSLYGKLPDNPAIRKDISGAISGDDSDTVK